ncbi:hypothetical protein AOXY_G18083, partial [Acipenser oxyrinchus oxyrinchus]
STYVVLKSSEQSRVTSAAVGSLPASADCSETSVSIDFPDEDKDNDPAKVQDWGALDPSAEAKTEEKRCEDETADRSSDYTGRRGGDVDHECMDDGLRSVTTSSVTSLFQRVQLDSMERDWFRFAALGNAAALGQLLKQDPTLASKKTARHWAAKHGRLEMAEMIAKAGVGVSIKSVSDDRCFMGLAAGLNG